MQTPQLERYQIVAELGRGAMGVVYKARDTVLDRIVAIKAVDMSREREGMANYEARFYQEARAAGSLNHPNIVTIYDIGKSGSIAYMAMEFIDGQELRQLMAGGRLLPAAQAISIAAQVAEGLAFAHERGIVHRDIKPANIMVVPDKPVKITDFGIARVRASTDLTQTGTMLGSPKYMSPEQALGKRAEPRSDVFSLGVILYEMLVGTPPFSGETVAGVMYQVVNFTPPAPSVLNPHVPAALDGIVSKMLAKPLDGRYPGAADAARELRELERTLAAGGPALPPRAPVGAPFPRPTMASWVDADEATMVLSQALDRTRLEDEAEMQTQGDAPALLDSAEAAQRLAQLSGLNATATQEPKVAAIPGAAVPSGRWRRRDWLLVGGATLLGLALGSAVLRRRRD